MSFVTRQAAHCDQCSHEWLVVGASTPTHCAKCKSRKWNGRNPLFPLTAESIHEAATEGVELLPSKPIKPDMQALQEICEGKIQVTTNSAGGWPHTVSVDLPPNLCIVCDSPMRQVKGKWACADMSCWKYGVEQKPRW